MEIRELRAFAVVAEEGSLSAAARRLHLSPSALSQTIQSLERGASALALAQLGAHVVLSGRDAACGAAGVRVNAVSPGPTRTEGTAPMGEALDQLASAAPSGAAGLPEEIAAAVTDRARDAASFVYGAVLPVDGGRIAV